MTKHILSLIKDSSIKKKLMMSYFLLIIIPLWILAVLSYNKSANIIKQNMINLTIQVLEQTSDSISGKFTDMVKTSELVAFNESLQNILSRSPEDYDIGKQIDDKWILENFPKNFENEQGIYRVRIYVPDTLIYSKENINYFSLHDEEKTDFYKNVASYKGKVCWIPTYGFDYNGTQDERDIISAARIILSRRNYGEVIGLVSIDILEANIRKALQNTPIAKNGIILLTDENGAVISCSNSDLLNKRYAGILQKFKDSKSQNNVNMLNIDHQNILAGYKEIKNTQWKLITLVSLDEILKPGKDLRNYTYILMLIIAVTAYILAGYISRFITVRLKKLVSIMRKAQQGNLDVRANVEYMDEIGELQNNFNYMINRINTLMDEKYRMGKEVKNAELKALQAQINPHFLYNTLELINWRANRYHADDIKILINSLAKFYKLSLSKGKEIITINDEIEHIKAYIEIQNQRFKGTIGFEVNVEQEIMEFNIIKLTLQPVVENAIFHGIMGRPEKTGKIEILGKLEGNLIILKVVDDGIGMEKEVLDNIFNSTGVKVGSSYGLKNVNERIKLFYGEEYGLHFESEYGLGTTVEIKIPALKNAP